MSAQAVCEADEVQPWMRRGLACRAAWFAAVVEHAGNVDDRFESGREPGRGDDGVERCVDEPGREFDEAEVLDLLERTDPGGYGVGGEGRGAVPFARSASIA